MVPPAPLTVKRTGTLVQEAGAAEPGADREGQLVDARVKACALQQRLRRAPVAPVTPRATGAPPGRRGPPRFAHAPPPDGPGGGRGRGS